MSSAAPDPLRSNSLHESAPQSCPPAVPSTAEDVRSRMGVTTTVFCVAGGNMSLIDGEPMAVDIRLPYYIAGAAALLGLAIMVLSCNRPSMQTLLARPGAPGGPTR